MKNLKSLGINLKTLQPGNYATLLEDLNYNFLQIINMPGFKGSPGESIKGDTGIGIRGSKWIFVKLTDFPGVQSINELNLAYINDFFINDPEEFISHLTIPDDSELVYGDTMVLPSGQIIQLITTVDGDRWVDSGISFEQVSGLTAEQVTLMIQELMGSTQDNDGYKYFSAIAKNVSDASPAQNQNMTQDSTVDVLVTGSGPGVLMNKWKFYGPAETQILQDHNVMQINGSIKRYHELIQATQEAYTNDYTPGVNDWAGFALLQNSYKNGFIFGNKISNTIRSFGRLYKSESATILTSSYSPISTEFTELQLFDDKIVLRANTTVEIKGTELKYDGTNINMQTIKQRKIGNNTYFTLTLGNHINNHVVFDTQYVFLDKIKNAAFLATDNDGKIISPYTLATNIESNSSTEIVSTAFLNDRLSEMEENIDDLLEDVEELMNADNSIYFKKNPVVTENSPTLDKNLNNHTNFGFTIFRMNILENLANSPLTPGIDDITGTASQYSSQIGFLKTYINNANINQSDNIDKMIEQYFHVRLQSMYTTGFGNASITNRKFVRTGTIFTNGTISFDSWREIPVGQRALRGDDTYIYVDGGAIKHQLQPNIQSTASSGAQVVRDITFDQAGHAVEVDVLDLITSGLTVPVGTVFHIASTTVPPGYLPCRGQYVWAKQYPNLYKVLKETFGGYISSQDPAPDPDAGIITGDPSGIPQQTKFKLPDLRGQFIRGWNNQQYLNLTENAPDTGRTFGSTQRDLIRKHKHATVGADTYSNTQFLPFGYIGQQNNAGAHYVPDYDNYIALSSDGTNITGKGNPNPDGAIGHETRPTNIALLAIIKI